jgi:hypothetical protein
MRVPLACFALVVGALPAAASALPTSAPLTLKQRMLQTGDLAGFDAPASRTVAVTGKASSWTAGEPDAKAETARLLQLGFVGAVIEHLGSPHLANRDAISVVVQFASSASANADVAHTRATYGGGSAPVTHFAVPGVPGATGFYTHRSDGAGYDIVFADGPYSYDVGAYTPDPKAPPTRAQLAAAAAKLYERIHGHPAP